MSYSIILVVLYYIRVRNWVGSHTVSVVLFCTLELRVSLVKSGLGLGLGLGLY